MQFTEKRYFLKITKITFFPKQSLLYWGSYLPKKELPKGTAPSKLRIFHFLLCFVYKTDEILRKYEGVGAWAGGFEIELERVWDHMYERSEDEWRFKIIGSGIKTFVLRFLIPMKTELYMCNPSLWLKMLLFLVPQTSIFGSRAPFQGRGCCSNDTD